MTERSIAIVGAGVAGLATGCYAQMNGYRTHIFEAHTLSGGVCTSWRRRGYIFDGCIEWLMGSRPGSSMHRTWEELGALDGREVVDHDVFMRIEGRDGRAFVVYTDVDRLEAHMRELAPADAAVTHAFCEAIRRCTALDPIAREGPDEAWPAGGLLGWLQMARAVPTLARFLGPTWQEFAARFTDRFLRDAFRSIFDAPDFPVLAGITTLAWLHQRDAGYPIGGSLAFAQAIEQRYRELGGEITFGQRVEKILVEGDRAVGVRLADGTEHRADVVVSAADGHATIFEMLEGRYVDATIRGYYDKLPLFDPIVQVSLGVARDFSDEAHRIIYPLREPFRVGGWLHEQLNVMHYCYDRTLAPAGKSALVTLIPTSYDYWADLVRDRERYEAEKRAIAQAVIRAVEERFPGTAEKVEVADVATPTTWVRYTSNWRGSYEGFLPTRKTLVKIVLSGGRLRETLPGLDNFYMVGQWVGLGGLPAVAPAGRDFVKRLCKRDGRPFLTSVAGHAPAHLLPVFGPEPEPTPVLVAGETAGTLRAHVNGDLCNGCGSCEVTAPHVMELGENGLAVARFDPIPTVYEAEVREAAEQCPEHALELAPA